MIFVLSNAAKAQRSKPDLTDWTVKTTDSSVIFEVAIENGWQLYSSDFDPDLGPVVATFSFSDNVVLKGDIKAVDSKKKYDDLWGGEYTYFKNKGRFEQIVDAEATSAEGGHTAEVNYQLCNEESGHCILYTEKFTFDLP